MRILVTGRDGQVARSLVAKAAQKADIEILCIGRPEFDLAQRQTIIDAVAEAEPDVIVSAAAYTAVDQAEDEPSLAFEINAHGAEAVASAAQRCGVPVVHLSTDYVFSGDSDEPYTEEDEPAPGCVYGRSKLQGEKLVAAANPKHVILRTAWVYSPFGKNFVKTMLGLAGQRESISVVADQIGNPTSALDIADAILCVIDRMGAAQEADLYGLYHLAGTGDASWSTFAQTIFSTSRECGGPTARVIDIPSDDFPTKARRPPNSRLSSLKFERNFGYSLPHWRLSLAEVVQQLVRSTG
ncbi:NAD(P)-dependent oxidoreductase [Nitratireductor aestuarii]|uniref:dTDP-4-dehydrorhamnose reductase n=1 Tax=Nitratireductor aestuarii TaxID=1735103 RepID=A0A916WBD3_9HYPH|nr:dTDP-4-dehydrorhamnose reductase [Nitratireductor aestuarii]GGA82675.1 NAD(P)-dependent oxidoreductase [Nitratireductor aestuarii]